MKFSFFLLGLAGLALFSGCATAGKSSAREPQVFPLASASTQALERPSAQAPDSGEPSGPELPADATLDDLLRYAAENNPEMRAAFEEWRASVERAPQARSLPDPTLRYSRALHEMQLRHSVMLSQMFPWFGKRNLRGGIAEERAKAAEERFEAERLAVAEAVITAYAEYAYVQEAIEVLREVHDIADQFQQVALTRFRAGEVASADALRAEMEAERVTDELRTMEEMRAPAAASLNAALGREEGAALPRARLEMQPNLQVDYGTLEARLVKNPRWRAAQHDIAASEKEVRLAQKESYPDITVGVEYMDHPWLEGNPVNVTASINLPIWQGRYAAGRREARASQRSAESRREAIERDFDAELRMAFFRVRDAERKIRLHGQSLLPLAQQTYSSLEAAYRGGDTDFLNLVEAQRTLLDHELLHRRAMADHIQRLATLERLVGGDLQTRDEP